MSEGDTGENGGSIDETTAGITEYLTPEIPGFTGILKHRYSDFNVNEVDLSSNVVKLRSTELPKEKTTTPEDGQKDFLPYGDLEEDRKSLFTPLAWSRLTQMSKKYLADPTKPSENDSIRIDVSSMDKEQRGVLHKTVKAHFSNLNSDTKTEGDKKYIVVNYIRENSDSKKRTDWPRDRPKFLHFTLYKENMDTFGALSVLAKGLNQKNNIFCIAGTKDKRGRTSQRCSVRWITAERLSKACKAAYAPGKKIVVGDFEYQSGSHRLGDLKGNHFSVVLRDISKPLSEFEPALISLKEIGFINYFGLQRFGTSSVPTSAVGLCAIKRDWEEMVEALLKPRSNERPPLSEARKCWWDTRDAQSALSILKTGGRFINSTIEGNVLRGLAKNAKDFVGALGFLGRAQRSMYTHAYQSLIWNQVVSRRLKKYGINVVIGDLVQVGEPPRKGSAEKVGSDEELDFSSHVRVVDENNIKDFSIYDVVMTKPGYDVRFPENEMKSWFEERLSEDGLTIEDFKNSVQDFNLPGSYRKILVRPDDVKWKVVGYSEENINLTLSDYDKIRGISPFNDEGDEGKYKALVLDFSLPTSCYATMALREVTKEQTSVTVQTKLTHALNEKRTITKDAIEDPHQPKKIKLESN